MQVVNLLDMVCMSVASAPGTSTVSLGSVLTTGPAGGGVLSFSAAGAVDGYAYRYQITDGNNRELAWGVYHATGQTLDRNTIIASINGAMQRSPISASAASIISSVAIAEDIVTPGNIGGFLPGGFVNKFRNPGFDIAQRGTSGTITSGASGYTLDGWIVGATGANLSWAQGQGSGGVPVYEVSFGLNGLVLHCASGITDAYVEQRIESSIAAQLFGHSTISDPIVTVQFSVWNATAAAITPTLMTAYPASAPDNFSSVTADVTATLPQVPTQTGAIVCYTFEINALSGEAGYRIRLDFGSGLNQSSGLISISGADIRATPGLIVGNTTLAPIPELRPIAAEQIFCERYYQKTAASIRQVAVVASQFIDANVFYRMMRAAPTVAITSGGVRNNVGSGPTAQSIGVNSLRYEMASSAGSNTDTYTIADILTLNAEL